MIKLTEIQLHFAILEDLGRNVRFHPKVGILRNQCHFPQTLQFLTFKFFGK